MSREVGVGLVGLGWMGRLHSKAWTSVAPVYPELGVRPVLAHVADPDPDRRAAAVRDLGYVTASADHRAVLADPRVEVLSVCAPNAAHREVALAACAAGTPFWIEKPAGRDAAETAEIAAAAAAAGVPTAVGFNYRHAPAVARIRELVVAGELGRVTSVRCAFHNGQAADGRVARSWRFQREHAGSGVLGDLLCHVVDLVRHTAGPAAGEVTEVASAAGIVHPRRPLPGAAGTHFDTVAITPETPMGAVDNEDHAVALARFAGGALGTLEVSRVAVGPQSRLLLEVSGTLGAAVWDFERMNELRLARLGEPGWTTVPAHAGMGQYARFQPGPAVAMGYDDLKVIEAAGFLAAVTGAGPGGIHPATMADARAAAEVVAAVADAAGQGGWTPVKGES